MRIYISAFIILGIVLGAHIMGLNGLYYKMQSYDVFMHLLGGIGIGLFVAAFLQMRSTKIHFTRINIVIGVILIGIIWELFEMYFNLVAYPLWSKMYFIDTIKDLINDTVGGVVVALAVSRKKREPVDKPIPEII